MSKEYPACRREYLRKAAVFALVLGLTTGLSGCLGSGSSGGGNGPTIEPTGVGWGIKLGDGNTLELVGTQDFTVEKDKDDNITKVTIGSRTITCVSPLSTTRCHTESGGLIKTSKMTRDGYEYLHILKWEQDTNTDTAGDMRLIGGKSADRTRTMPANGTANYEGDVGGVVRSGDDETGFEGKVSLTANFGNGTVTGSLHDFREDDDTGQGRRLDGTVTLQNGRISGNTMSAGLAGSVGGHNIDSDRTRMNGGFFGPNAEEVGGGIVGRTTAGGQFGAIWAARKQ